MPEVGVHEAKTTLSKLLERVEAGEEITITRRGVPVARLTGTSSGEQVRLGTMRGQLRIADDFDAPLPDSVLTLFEGEG